MARWIVYLGAVGLLASGGRWLLARHSMPVDLKDVSMK